MATNLATEQDSKRSWQRSVLFLDAAAARQRAGGGHGTRDGLEINGYLPAEF